MGIHVYIYICIFFAVVSMAPQYSNLNSVPKQQPRWCHAAGMDQELRLWIFGGLDTGGCLSSSDSWFLWIMEDQMRCSLNSLNGVA